MPEGIEVCLTALYLNDQFENYEILKIKLLSGRYKNKEKSTGLDYLDNYFPIVLNSVNSKGKFLWFDLGDDKKFYIFNTFGLEGSWGRVKSKHSGIEILLRKPDNKKIEKIYFTDMMHYGTFDIISQKKKLDEKLAQLGDDLLKTEITPKYIEKKIKEYILNKKGKVSESRGDKEIVKVLMDQKKKTGIGSGLGNYLVAEILYEAKISPHKKMIDIYNSKALTKKLAIAMKKILRLSYMTSYIGYLDSIDPEMKKYVKKLRAEIKKNPNHEYNFQRTARVGNRKFSFKVYRNGDAKKDKIIKGRTTYWDPEVQK